MITVQVVGLGMSPADLTPRAKEIILEAQVLVGGRRLLDYFPEHRGMKIPLGKDPEGTLKQLPALAETKRVVVLASGDPNFYGVGPLVVKVLGAKQVVIHPNLTAVQTACARLQMPWQDATVISLHGRSWEHLAAVLGKPGPLLIYTDPAHPPGEIARFLLARGLSSARFCVLEDLGQDAERVTWMSLAEAQAREFSSLNLVVVAPEPGEASSRRPQLHLGLPEAALVHQAGLITKAEVRAVVLAKLALGPGQVLWDVGAGCGSVGLEASLLVPRGKVFAVERHPERAAQIAANRDKFGVHNLEVVCAPAPVCLAPLPDPHRVFVGGGGPEIGAIIQEAVRRLGPEGRMVVTAALLETLATARTALEQAGWEVEVVQIQVSRSHPLAGGTALRALNPVWIVTGYWTNTDEKSPLTPL
ncbi:MAG: precorrin-6y C5,15-methyltransferase (decarboxylating) subunit CbiE [Deltaproteobacteria bacterium]|nr:precorrin-6y C5,15-methyltransferase (decarboxylating) subunit CbiE [Deltaproteobacteria bacterium]